MNSMTGFGKSDSQSKELSLNVSVRAINGRYLEVKVFLPRFYQPLEAEIRKLVGKTMKRGTVEVSISRKSHQGKESVTFNEPLAKKWLSGYRELAKNLKLAEPTQANVLLSVPDLVSVDEVSLISDAEKKQLLEVIEEAVSACGKVRSQEGEGLLKDLQDHMKSLDTNLKEIKKLREKTTADLQKKYIQRLEQLGLDGTVDEQRLGQEIVIMVDKSDISEEIQRLSAHIEAVRELLQGKGSLGKKLDFYAQELLREVNTIGSKSTSSELTKVVIDCKAIVEKYREQVQNVE